jgi:hypothetical protein
LLGHVTGQSLVTIPDAGIQGWPDALDERPRACRLRSLPALHVERHADHDLVDVVIADEGGDRRAVAFGVVRAPERRQGQGAAAAIRDGDADPAVADIEPEQTGHGAAEAAGGRLALADGGWLALDPFEGSADGPPDAPGGPWTVRSSRESNPVTVEAQEGQRTIFAAP